MMALREYSYHFLVQQSLMDPHQEIMNQQVWVPREAEVKRPLPPKQGGRAVCRIFEGTPGEFGESGDHMPMTAMDILQME